MGKVHTPTVLHLFSGAGGGAIGFHRAGFRSLGAVDSNPEACADLEYLTGEKATVADLGAMTPAQLRALTRGETPDVVFTSPPCKGFSGCLPTASAKTAKYLELNSLALRGIWLALEAWDRPPPLVVLENVPRMRERGAKWLDQATALLRHYGYATDISTHDCGEIGGLAQRRRRLLLVARHMEQVPDFLRQPVLQRVRAVGEVLGELPVPRPGSTEGGPMHALPRLSPKNWLRLALIPAGGDWRDLPEKVALHDSSTRQNGPFGVTPWDATSRSVLGAGKHSNTWASVADPRLPPHPDRHAGKLGVEAWGAAAKTVIGKARPCNTWASIADPRVACSPRAGTYGVQDWKGASPTILGAHRHDSATGSIADPRIAHGPRSGSYGVQDWVAPARTVKGAHTTSNAPGSIADPRVTCTPRPDSWGMQPWAEPAHTIRGMQRVQTTRAAVDDPRTVEPTHRVLAGDIAAIEPALDLDDRTPQHIVILAADGTWHRPLTTLELAVIQGFPAEVNGEPLKLAGDAHGRWRERIGNAVPPPAAEAIARECGACLARARAGTFALSSQAIWVERHAEVPLG